METLRVQIESEKAKKVREKAMKRFGYYKGSISMAINEALEDWIKKPAQLKTSKKPDWDSLIGVLKEMKIGSVELQHKAFLLKNQKQ